MFASPQFVCNIASQYSTKERVVENKDPSCPVGVTADVHATQHGIPVRLPVYMDPPRVSQIAITHLDRRDSTAPCTQK